MIDRNFDWPQLMLKTEMVFLLMWKKVWRDSWWSYCKLWKQDIVWLLKWHMQIDLGERYVKDLVYFLKLKYTGNRNIATRMPKIYIKASAFKKKYCVAKREVWDSCWMIDTTSCIYIGLQLHFSGPWTDFTSQNCNWYGQHRRRDFNFHVYFGAVW